MSVVKGSEDENREGVGMDGSRVVKIFELDAAQGFVGLGWLCNGSHSGDDDKKKKTEKKEPHQLMGKRPSGSATAETSKRQRQQQEAGGGAAAAAAAAAVATGAGTVRE